MHESVVTGLLWVGLIAAPSAAQPAQPVTEALKPAAARLAGVVWQPQHGAARFSAPSKAPRQSRRQQRHLIDPRLLGAFAGAVGGMLAGGYLGMAIEGSGGHYDSPGLKGFLIGAPVGGVAGAVIGWKLVK